ncbi:MAG TPA: glycosyltransferase family 2 protein [Thermoleophilaceae bacterium]
MKLSVVIPAHNEEGSIGRTVESLALTLERESIPYEIVVVADHCADGTAAEVLRVGERHSGVRAIENQRSGGFGYAVRAGLDAYTGDAVAIMMADLSDSPEDLITYYRLLERGFDCAFGSRFMPGARVTDYPKLKLLMNRFVNFGIRLMFRHGYNDTTNAFKAYRRDVVDNVQPLLSAHFNLTVELPLKALVRGHSYAIVPVSWTNRVAGESKLKLQEMGSRYAFIVLYILLEHLLSGGDYHRGRIAKWRERRRSMRPWQRADQLPGAARPDDGGDGLQQDREIQEDRPALEI